MSRDLPEAFEAHRREEKRMLDLEMSDAAHFPDTEITTKLPRQMIEAHSMGTSRPSYFDPAVFESLESSLVTLKAGANAVPKPEKILGAMLGSACGDALAAPVEFLSFEAIAEQFPPSGPSEELYQVTDDTQMAMAVGRALIAAQGSLDDPASVSQAIIQEFIAWYHDPENNRAPGNTCMSACMVSPELPGPFRAAP
jgi:hypothetical protein